MNKIYILKGFLYIISLPFITGKAYFVARYKQVAHYRNTAGGMAQPPVQGCD